MLLEYPTSRCAYTTTATAYLVIEQIDKGTLIIPFTEIGDWLDAEIGGVAFTDATLKEFLQNNTANFKSATGGNVADGLIVGQIPVWDGMKYEPSNDKNIGDQNLISNSNIRSFSLFGSTSGQQFNIQNNFGQKILQSNGIGQVWSYGKGFKTANTAFGDGCFNAMSSGNGNSAFGTLSSPNLSSGFDNVSMGRASMFGATNASRNTAIGYFSLARNVSGANNTALGMLSGESSTTTILTSVSNGVFIGHNTRALANGSNNEIVIGAQGIGNGSNTATIGNASIIATFLKGVLNIANTPTSPTGLNAGDVWNNAGILTIV